MMANWDDCLQLNFQKNLNDRNIKSNVLAQQDSKLEKNIAINRLSHISNQISKKIEKRDIPSDITQQN